MKKICIYIFFTTWALNGLAQNNGSSKVWQIDSLVIHKNWRTRDKIILRELEFNVGETINQDCLQQSINQVWNIGNFAQVNYSIDSISPTGHVLNLTARDAFNFVPYITVSGNNDDKNMALGFSDNNFLGRNIDLSLSGNIGTYSNSYKLSFGLPRQLLYKNMTLSVQLSAGSSNNFRYKNNKKVSVVAYHSKQFSGNIGNPWHSDYNYSFSPNLSWNLFQHKTDTSLVDTDVHFAEDYKVNYLALSIGESFGLINRIRHQHNGYSISGAYGIGIGLDNNSPIYHALSFGASYYKTFNPIVELSASFSTGYITSTIPSLIHYMNSGDVKGIINGQESGQANYNGKLNAGFTYLNYNWFAMEQSVYAHLGMANDRYFDIYKHKPRISIGTRFRFWTPMIPWLAASIHFTYVKGNNNWFHLDI
ncbi:BamA/TamA family outer membrane protein [uncultured Draconibacterium sp.]|uniref:BamA/TamA family outer membrane protein n=1 Tax=uncultured Draconibacterium sp. TaxID=1573823 RepID=UPI0032163764